ncbi:MAG TPA: cytochrome c [Trueperaceae bacterium]
MSDTQGRPTRGRAGGPRALRLATAALTVLAALALAQEADELPKGIGPIAEVELGEIDPERVAAGRATFESLCSACHRFGERYVGPDLLGVTERRAPEWIMNMVLNTNEMLFEDDTAYGLLAEYMTPMPQLPLTEEQVRDVLEFFRHQDSQLGN